MRIGVDLGGTKIEGIVLQDDGEVATRQRAATPAASYQDTVDAVCGMVKSLQTFTAARMPVGIGTPGALSMPAGVMKNSNSVCLNDKPLKDDLEAHLGYEIRLENDANCFVLSEAHLGVARHANIVFGVIIGTGTGGGLVVDGSLVKGPNAIAGEWGHNSIPSNVRELIAEDRNCYCGRRNCIETVLSGRGLKQTFFERHGITLEAHDIAAQAAQGDARAQECIELYSQQLARCLTTVINVLDPHMVVLGGGLSNIEALYTLVPKELERFVFTDTLHTVLSSPSFGDSSGALGAACLWPR